MHILIIGSGAREHAIANALQRSPQQPRIFCCGTTINPGIQSIAQAYWVGEITNVQVITEVAKQWQIDLVIIGSEAPLEKGLADALWEIAIPTIGPKQALAQIETSKAFARQLMQQYHIPGLPRYKVFQHMNGAEDFLPMLGENNYVIKANGLMSGKGVKVAGDHLFSFTEALQFCEEINAAGHSFIIEEKLIGQEFSFMCFCDGEKLIPMPLVQDHKRVFVDDKGPNTGGMGSYSAANHGLPFLTANDMQQAWQINQAVIYALTKELQDRYIGILYGSFIATKNGVHVIEFNARFGDPESLNVLSILETDFVTICQAMVAGNLSADLVRFKHQATVCKYAVPVGYPDQPLKNIKLNVDQVKDKSQLYFAGVNLVNDDLIATGSRTAAFVGIADTITLAEKIAEKEIGAIQGQVFHREDIGTASLIQQRIEMMRVLREEVMME